jgi:branched-chain amino acid transport system permease protein
VLFLVVSQIINGIVTGMIYALVGVGLTLILGVLNIPNFAHGVLFAFGAYILLSVLQVVGNFWLALLIAPFGVVLLGLLLELVGVRRLYTAHHDYQLLFLFAVALILQETIILIWGPIGTSVLPPEGLQGAVNLGLTVYPKYRLVVMGITAAIVAGTWLFLTRTNVGAIVRAGIENREMVAVLGIDIQKVFALTFGLGAWLAGVAGGLASPIMGLTPSMGFDILPIAFVIVVVAGLGSVPGAIVAGILTGVAQSLTTIVFPEAANVVIYLLMGLMIVVRPQGLFGKR